MGRKCENFLDTYVQATARQEAPEIFHKWVGLSLLSAALDRNVYLNRGGVYKLFPNLYVCLVAGSAGCSKSTAIKLGLKNFLKPALPSLNWSSQRINNESFIRALSRIYSRTSKSSILLCNDELLTLFGIGSSDQSLVSTLTALYDCPDEWVYETIGRGRDVIQNAYITGLFGTTPNWLRRIIPTDSVGAGFTGRMLFVYKAFSDRKIAFPETAPALEADCVHDLKQIGLLKGEFELAESGRRWYDEWYTKKYDSDAGGSQIEGYMKRKKDTVLKTAMLTSVSEREDLQLRRSDMESGLRLLDEIEKDLPFVMNLVEQTELGGQAAEVYDLLLQIGDWVYFHALLRRFRHKMSDEDLTKIVNSLISAKLVVRMREDRKDDWRVKIA